MAIELSLLSRVSYRDRAVTGARLRGLLALLAADLRTGCGTSRLVEGVWPDGQPEAPTKALQVLVSRLRTRLGSGVVARTATGYRLVLSEDQVDASAVLLRAAASERQARAGDHAAALAHAEAGLALFDGAEEAADGRTDPLSTLRAERASTRRALIRARALALARLGRQAEAVEPLSGVARERPRDEEVLLELLRCRATTSGPATALVGYDEYRRALREELGTNPGPALQELHLRLLRGEAPAVRHGLRHEPNPLLGRDADVAAVANLLATSRVTSIVGVGGLGKTRLAHVVSRQAQHRVVHFVPLAGVVSDDEVLATVASALGVSEPRPGASTSLLEGIVEAFGAGPALLVLDNCEHVVRGTAELVRALVAMAKELSVLTTSRAPLGLSSESVYPLPELSLPTAVELFEQRARAARPGVELPGAAVAELCRHLDGLPLAVELAAARVRVLSVGEIGRRFADRFALLRGGARDAPGRHQDLHAVVDWSWQLVEPAGQAAMRALSIFPGGFTEEAARHLLGTADALPTLEKLVDQSLLKVVDTPSGTRFGMLETVREFSTAQREAAGETDPATRSFLGWARGFGLARYEAVFGADLFAAARLIRAEQDNLSSAVRAALAREDGATVAATTAVLAALWTVESNFARASALVAQTAPALSHYRPAPEFVEIARAAATLSTANKFALLGPRASRSLATLRRLPPAAPDTMLGAVAFLLAAAPQLLGPDRLRLHALCDSEEPMLAGAANHFASYLWEYEGDLESALKGAERTIDPAGDRSSPWIWASGHCRAAELCLQVEEGDQARRHLMAALPILEGLGVWSITVGVRWSLALTNLQLGDVDEAERWLEPTALVKPEGSVSAVDSDLAVRAEILLARGEVEAGLRLWRRALDRLLEIELLSDSLGLPIMSPWVLEHQAVAVVAHARHGRPDLVRGLVDELPDELAEMLANPVASPPVYLKELLVCGAMLLAIAMVDLDRGARTSDQRATRSGARLVAMAERFGYLRNFQPTMSAVEARQAAERADRSAYADAVSSYADLGPDQLRLAALAELRNRGS